MIRGRKGSLVTVEATYRNLRRPQRIVSDPGQVGMVRKEQNLGLASKLAQNPESRRRSFF